MSSWSMIHRIFIPGLPIYDGRPDNRREEAAGPSVGCAPRPIWEMGIIVYILILWRRCPYSLSSHSSKLPPFGTALVAYPPAKNTWCVIDRIDRAACKPLVYGLYRRSMEANTIDRERDFIDRCRTHRPSRLVFSCESFT